MATKKKPAKKAKAKKPAKKKSAVKKAKSSVKKKPAKKKAANCPMTAIISSLLAAHAAMLPTRSKLRLNNPRC